MISSSFASRNSIKLQPNHPPPSTRLGGETASAESPAHLLWSPIPPPQTRRSCGPRPTPHAAPRESGPPFQSKPRASRGTALCSRWGKQSLLRAPGGSGSGSSSRRLEEDLRTVLFGRRTCVNEGHRPPVLLGR